jgi:hypothetical protein
VTTEIEPRSGNCNAESMFSKASETMGQPGIRQSEADSLAILPCVASCQVS